MITYLKGSAEEELNFNIRDLMPENCALAAAVNLPNASYWACEALYAMENRGEAGAGIISIDKGEFYERRRIGPVSVQFMRFKAGDFERHLPGRVAIGHNRYATQGNHLLVANVQPLIVYESKFGPFAVAHNGTLVNSRAIRQEVIKNGSVFQSTTDTELLIHLIANSGQETIEEAIKYAFSRISSAYALFILTKDKLFAVRDRFGVRPLSIAKLGEGYLVCSETYAFDQFEKAIYLRDIEPGEMAVFQHGQEGFQSIQYAEPDEHFCIFEAIYFANPRTLYHGFCHEDFRKETGKEIARSHPGLKGDCIVPILDSGKHAARGLAEAVGIELYEELFQRAHRPKNIQSRSFTSPTFEEREKVVWQKLHLRKDKIRGRDVILVDDSIVRSTTMKILVRIVRDAGAKSATVCVASPTITAICPSGMDYQDTRQLVAHDKSVEDIKNIIGADKLIYLTLEELKNVVARTYGCGICSGCFGGEYPVQPNNFQ